MLAAACGRFERVTMPARKVVALRLFAATRKLDKVEPPEAAAAFDEAFGRIARDMIAWTVQALS
jgi:phospholipid/cholesterol/gamma-HCH transport system substrate-binding protein